MLCNLKDNISHDKSLMYCFIISLEYCGAEIVRRICEKLPLYSCTSCVQPSFLSRCSRKSFRSRREISIGKERVGCTEKGIYKWWGARGAGFPSYSHHWQITIISNHHGKWKWKWKTWRNRSCLHECKVWSPPRGLVCVNVKRANSICIPSLLFLYQRIEGNVEMWIIWKGNVSRQFGDSQMRLRRTPAAVHRVP